MENVSLERVSVTKVTFGERVAKLLSAVWSAIERNRSRIALSELTDEQLADIGISRYEAELECRKFDLFSDRFSGSPSAGER